MIETYIQNLEPDDELGTVPKSDKYFLGKLNLKDGVSERSLLPEPGFGNSLKTLLTQFYSVRYSPSGFAQMILLDGKRFDRDRYLFEYVRQEFLGEVRCFVFDVQPNPKVKDASFIGRIWVEDQGYNVVRFNGTYRPSETAKMFFHFDSWREQMGAGQWLPAYIYSEESDLRYFFGTRKLRFKGLTRIWGYRAEQPKAEGDLLQRLQKAGLLAPEGEVDKVLQTVVTNLEVTNNLSIDPETRARVLLTSPLESFSVGHTIVVSRGLIDVLPDEASLAMVLAHELAHISLGHGLDTEYAFANLHAKRDKKEEREADRLALEFLKNSPYKDKLGNAGLFLRALHERAGKLPNLLKSRMGNRLTRAKDLMRTAPKLETTKVEQVAALPLGGRLRVDPWSNRVELVKTKPVVLRSAREKMPFEVTPVFLQLTRQKQQEAQK